MKILLLRNLIYIMRILIISHFLYKFVIKSCNIIVLYFDLAHTSFITHLNNPRSFITIHYKFDHDTKSFIKFLNHHFTILHLLFILTLHDQPINLIAFKFSSFC